MRATEHELSGSGYLAAATALLQRARRAHPTRGVWEAADVQWWWRRPRPTDDWPHPFWFDGAGNPIAAVVTTDWGNRFALDVIALPSVHPKLIEEAWDRGLAAVGAQVSAPLEVMVDDEDRLMVALLRDAGFTPRPDKGRSAWTEPSVRPPMTPLLTGYTLRSRADRPDQPHHMASQAGSGVAQRLEEISLYRPELDLVVIDPTGVVAAYGIFWFDPTTAVGFVEPMGTHHAHRRRGLAGHLLAAGIGRLLDLGATRVKVNYEVGNDAARALYLAAGFVPLMTTSLYVRGTLDP